MTNYKHMFIYIYIFFFPLSLFFYRLRVLIQHHLYSIKANNEIKEKIRKTEIINLFFSVKRIDVVLFLITN